MATATSEKKTSTTTNAKSSNTSEQPTYVISEQELRDLQELQAFQKAVRIVHSVDSCPECPVSYTDMWKEESEEARLRVVAAMARMAAGLVDSNLGLHSSEKSPSQSNSYNGKRLQMLVEFAAANIFPVHSCEEGHTGCV
ncbi:hypothetical protein ACBI99_35245 [Nonomuraea sp. ATR24]|uniref:hypothetical protein n=1 Tax=Nonomuraea sp. ATR24 TaxID=1676744 RepID=UPI0035C0FFE3